MQPNKQRVLVVDDDVGICDALSQCLLRRGFEVAVAENGVQALRIFSEEGFDLVLTDLKMPHMDGLMLASDIKKKQPQTLLIMMSGYAQTSVQPNNVVDYFVAKPFGLKEIYNLMNCAFESASSADVSREAHGVR